MSIEPHRSAKPLSVLFLCTQNSARSQIAEALMTRKIERIAPGLFTVASAGSTPARRGNPMAFAHWGMDDPSEILDERARERAFTETTTYLARRAADRGRSTDPNGGPQLTCATH